MMKYLLSCKCSDNCKGWILLFLRVIIGIVFLAHGSQKIGTGGAGVAQFFGSLGIPLSLFSAYVVMYVEFLGGIMLILGLFTHWASKFLAVVMLVAFFTVHISKGVFVSNGGFELVAVIFGGLLVIMTFGAGELALEKYLKRNNLTN